MTVSYYVGALGSQYTGTIGSQLISLCRKKTTTWQEQIDKINDIVHLVITDINLFRSSKGYRDSFIKVVMSHFSKLSDAEKCKYQWDIIISSFVSSIFTSSAIINID